MPENLDNRKRKILQAIIEEYIETSEPVSSGSLVQNEELNCSSATIRNEMAELEQIGFLEKPHTSAGRVPSQKGYRYYVDELLREDNLSRKEIEMIKEMLETKVNGLEDLARIATTTLSEITHYTTISIEPNVNNHTIVDIKFILLGTRVLMAVILTDSGIIRESVIKFDEDLTQDQINDLTYIFKNKLVGKPLEKIDGPIEEYIMSEMKTGIKVIEKIIEEINKLLESSTKTYIEGANKVVDMPEFKKLAVRSPDGQESDILPNTSEFKGMVYIDDGYAYQEFGYEAYYLGDTGYGILADDKILELAAEICDIMLNAGNP